MDDVVTYLISLYSWVMVPPALMIASFACCTTLSGVSSGYETMMFFCGCGVAMAKVRRAAMDRIAIFMMRHGVISVLLIVMSLVDCQ